MRHRIKKIPNLSIKNHLLHSDKSTFSKESRRPDSLMACAHTSFFGRCSGWRHVLSASLKKEKPIPGEQPNENKRMGSSFCSLSSAVRNPLGQVLGRAKEMFAALKGRTEIPSEKVSSGLTKTYFYKHSMVKNIPLILSAFAFLLVLGLMVSPVGFVSVGSENAYAETINYPAVEGSNNAASISFTLNGGDIDGSEVSTEVVQDEVSYINNTLKVTTNNIGKFAIVIQSASNNGNLTNSENGATIAPISSATTPNNFTSNTWGYALSDTNDADSALTYNPLPAFQEEPTAQYTKNDPDDGNYNLKLVFAAKIGSNKPAGHYKTTALVSVVAEAKSIINDPVPAWGELQYMQQMSPEACNSANIGDSKTLIDSRDMGTSYMIKKLADNKCWMIDNLRIINKKITPDDSDITSNFTIPASSNPWDSSVGYEGTRVHYASDAAHGAYYTWYTATAGTGTSSVTSGQASGSICPKGWRLPTGDSSGEFQTLYNTGHSDWTTNNSINGYWLGGASSSVAGAAFFTASGLIYGSLVNVGSRGYYWSSTPSSNSNSAYYLLFSNDNVSPADGGPRYYGFSVRCVAK